MIPWLPSCPLMILTFRVNPPFIATFGFADAIRLTVNNDADTTMMFHVHTAGVEPATTGTSCLRLYQLGYVWVLLMASS